MSFGIVNAMESASSAPSDSVYKMKIAFLLNNTAEIPPAASKPACNSPSLAVSANRKKIKKKKRKMNIERIPLVTKVVKGVSFILCPVPGCTECVQNIAHHLIVGGHIRKDKHLHEWQCPLCLKVLKKTSMRKHLETHFSS